MYADCDIRYNTTTVHFWFDDNCYEEPRNPELPYYIPYMQNVDCNHLCEDDGYYSKISLDVERKQVCEVCPPNMYSVNGGFIVDALMDDEDHLQQKILKHFSKYCENLSLG